jgi:hypothetical protein
MNERTRDGGIKLSFNYLIMGGLRGLAATHGINVGVFATLA